MQTMDSYSQFLIHINIFHNTKLPWEQQKRKENKVAPSITIKNPAAFTCPPFLASVESSQTGDGTDN